MTAPAPITQSTAELMREMRKEQAPSCPRIELVVAIHSLASHFENALDEGGGAAQLQRAGVRSSCRC